MDEWWTFVPLLGLEMTDDSERLLFGDSTIISGVKFRQLTSSTIFGESYHSVLAIKRRGKTMGETGQHIAWSAHERAVQVGTALSMLLLRKNDSGDTCCLSEHLHEWKRVVFSYASSGEFRALWRGARPFGVNRDHPICMSISQLCEILSSEDCRAFIMLTIRPGKSSSLREAVSAATVRLGSALMHPNPSELILGTVTSMEILLSEQGEPFDVLKRRLESLLGKGSLSSLHAEEVLHSRHAYVHRGKSPSLMDGVKISVFAAHLGINALFRYAELAERFRSKVALVSYLDFVSSGQRLVDHDPTYAKHSPQHTQQTLDIKWPTDLRWRP